MAVGGQNAGDISFNNTPVTKARYNDRRLFNNSGGSVLAFQATMGVLRTSTYKAKFEDTDTMCVLCKEETETIQNVILKCKELSRAVHEGALGLAIKDGRVYYKRIEATKRRL